MKIKLNVTQGTPICSVNHKQKLWEEKIYKSQKGRMLEKGRGGVTKHSQIYNIHKIKKLSSTIEN